MQKLFENWRKYQKEVICEARRPEYLGAWQGKGGGDLRHIYVIDGQAYYTSLGTGGITEKGDLVQFGGIVEADIVPGPKGDEVATRKVRDEYIKKTMAGGTSYGNVYKGEWVVKNPAGKDIGDQSGKQHRDFKAERSPRVLSTEDINKTLKKRGILRPNWAVRHGLEHIDFPGVTKVRRLRRGEKPPKGGSVDPLYDRSVVRRNDPKIQKQINKELRELGKLPPERTFKQFIIKYSTKIPLLGRFFKVIFASTIATMVVAEAEEAYAKGGPEAAALVYTNNAADWVPLLGDIKGGVEIAMALTNYYGEDIMTLGGLLPQRSRPDASGEPGDIEDYPMEYPDAVGTSMDASTPEEEIGPWPEKD